MMSVFMGDISILEVIADEVEKVLLCYIHTKQNVLDRKYYHVLPLAIVHIALIICTQCTGRLPPTLYILNALKINESDLNNIV